MMLKGTGYVSSGDMPVKDRTCIVWGNSGRGAVGCGEHSDGLRHPRGSVSPSHFRCGTQTA